MSFDYTCFYILTKKTIDSSTYGDISGPFSKTEIEKNYLNEYILLTSTIAPTIITDIPNFSSKQHLVGIPTKNLNLISRNKLYFYMATYNIGALLSIAPYKPLGGNDTGEGAEEICINPEEKKRSVLLRYNNIARMTIPEIIAILSRGNIHPNRHCIFRR